MLAFSRIQELGSMHVLLDMLLDLLRERVGSPLSLASLGRDLQLSQPTVKRYLMCCRLCTSCSWFNPGTTT